MGFEFLLTLAKEKLQENKFGKSIYFAATLKFGVEIGNIFNDSAECIHSIAFSHLQTLEVLREYPKVLSKLNANEI